MALAITLPPTPKPATTLAAYEQAVNIWTRQCQQAVTQIASAINGLGSSDIPIANSTTTGLLSAADWNVFNSKQPAGSYLTDAPADSTIYGRKNNAWVPAGGTLTTGDLTETGSAILTITGGTGAVIGTGTSIQVKQASTSQAGFLSASDWNTFNGKQSLLTLGNLTEATSSVLTVTGGTGAIVGAGLTIQVKQATTSQAGYLSAADWNTFNSKLSSLTVGNFTEATSSVLTITGGTGAVIGSGLTVQVKQANGSTNGYLSSTDWTTFNGKLDGIKGIKTVVLCSAFTPALVGADAAEVVVPFASDGSSLTFTIKRLTLRVNITGGAPSINIEKSTVVGAFSPTTVGTVTLSSGASEGSTTTSLGSVASGNKLRFNVTTLASAQNWTITVEIAP